MMPSPESQPPCGTVAPLVVSLFLTALASGAEPPPADAEVTPSEAAAPGDADELSRQATDPTASLMAFNFQGIYNDFHGPDVPGEPDDRWTLQFRPVIPFTLFDQPNILRMTVPYQVSGRGDEGWGPISVFDLVVFNQSWGRWGLGPVMSFDTTGEAPDAFALGPAVGAVWRAGKKLNLGVFSQNVFWSDTAVSQWQPVIAYQLGQGWALSAGDLQFTYDWQRGGWVSVPIGFQIGKVRPIARQPMRFALNPQWNLRDVTGAPKVQLTFTVTILAPVR